MEKYIKRLEDIGISFSLIVESMRNDFLQEKIQSASIDDIYESQKQFNLACQKLKYLDKLKVDIQTNFKKLADFNFVSASGHEELMAWQSISGADVKIEMHVKKKLIGIYQQKQFTDEQIFLMCDKQWSSQKFKLNYPLLKEIDESKDFSEQRYFGSYLRYWSEPVVVNNKKYFICSQWFEKQRKYFDEWTETFDYNVSSKKGKQSLQTTDSTQTIKINLYSEFTKKKPYKLFFMSKEYNINNWREFFFRVIYCLIEIDKDKIEAFVYDPSMQGRDMENISLSPSKMRLPMLVQNTKIYVETNASANGFRNRVIDMLNKFCIDLSEVEIECIIK